MSFPLSTGCFQSECLPECPMHKLCLDWDICNSGREGLWTCGGRAHSRAKASPHVVWRVAVRRVALFGGTAAAAMRGLSCKPPFESQASACCSSFGHVAAELASFN